MDRITPADCAEQIRQKLAQGVRVYTGEEMMNSGGRRTLEKREMLKRLKELAEERGQTSWPAKF